MGAEASHQSIDSVQDLRQIKIFSRPDRLSMIILQPLHLHSIQTPLEKVCCTILLSRWKSSISSYEFFGLQTSDISVFKLISPLQYLKVINTSV